jgi:hypothetical protein
VKPQLLSRWAAWWVALAACAAAGCYDTEVRPQTNVVVAIFDPAATPPQIPLPNDLTMMPASPTAVAAAAFSGLIDPTTITPMSVLVFDLVTMGPVLGASATFNAMAMPAPALLISPPPGGWPIGHRIAIALRGSPGGLVGVGGVPVVASPAFFFVRSSNPISNCIAPAPNCMSATPALPVEQAIGLELLREQLAPVVGAFVAAGVPRAELALVWTFTVGAP